MELLKDKLNEMDDKYTKQQGANLDSKMINYFLRSKENIDFVSLLSNLDGGTVSDDDDESSVSSEQDELEDDLESIDGVEDYDTDDNRCGSLMEVVWMKRSAALRTDIAIAGWMCSPIPEIMEDCTMNHKGEHKIAVTRLLKKWFIHEVRIIKIY